jgi:hypothetical protein
MKIKAIDGRPVIDAKKPLNLTITKNDIDKADAKEPAGCAVARACRRELHVVEARVHLARIYLRSNEGNWVRYMTPRAMRSEIIAFDRGGRFQPNTFQLVPPNTADRLGAKRKTGPKMTKKAKRRKPTIHHVLTDIRNGPA